ncbi:MAG: hypothetical protein HQK88_13030 [Nitrospirae bacterium]|nr:hypothetical protein [Nitrospirota bacterium]MBF0520745.1 hypothetical protein [Nitrospirota bacterium]MBF0535809.1 hypothetical protein [Nitrospirota bacterium]MBF0617726.1 hypothetical protein [Nitrospirota bacterium]
MKILGIVILVLMSMVSVLSADTVSYHLPYLHTNTSAVTYCVANNSSSNTLTVSFTATATANGASTNGATNSYGYVISGHTTRMFTFSGQVVYQNGPTDERVDLVVDTDPSASYGGVLSFSSTGTSGTLNCKNVMMSCFQGTTNPKRNLVGIICDDNTTAVYGF